MYYAIDPEVAGGWGEGTVVDTSVHPPMVSRLVYEFDGWVGDDLLTTSPVYIVTERLGRGLEDTEMTGFTLDDVKVTTSEFFDKTEPIWHPGRTLPKFYWLKVHGEAGKDDVGVAAGVQLVVSEHALEFLRRFNIEHAEIRNYTEALMARLQRPPARSHRRWRLRK